MKINEILKHRGYILESDCANAPILSSNQIENYKGKSSTYIDQTEYVYALYNSNKFTKEKIAIRIKYKKPVAIYMCNNAKLKNTVHYQDFNKFLNSLGLDYFKNKDIRYMVEEICNDFKILTNGSVLSAILVSDSGISSDGFWTLSEVINRIGSKSQQDFHLDELNLLETSLSNFQCDMI